MQLAMFENSGSFIPVPIGVDMKDHVLDWKQSSIDGTIYDFMRLSSGGGRTYVVELDGVGEIARASLNDYDRSFNGNYLDNIRVDSQYRRIGIASRLYQYIEGVIGKQLKPSPIKQSSAIKQYWSKRL